MGTIVPLARILSGTRSATTATVSLSRLALLFPLELSKRKAKAPPPRVTITINTIVRILGPRFCGRPGLGKLLV